MPEMRIIGDDMQIVELVLDPGEAVRAEPGAMVYKDDAVGMETTAGGIFKGLKRMIAGEGFFTTRFFNGGDRPAVVAFGEAYPGKVMYVDLEEERGEFLCQRSAFLCASEDVDISIAFTKRLGAGFFGGEGFVLERLRGEGFAFLHAGGTIVEKQLDAGCSLQVDTGCIVGLSSSVDYSVKFVGGFRNALFGGEGLFLAHLTGPGRVFLQSLPLSRLAARLAAAVPKK